MDVIINNLVTFVVSTLTGIVTYLIGRKRATKEIDGLQLQNLENQITIYNKIIQDLSDRVEILLEKVNCLEGKIDELKKENSVLKEMVKNNQ